MSMTMHGISNLTEINILSGTDTQPLVIEYKQLVNNQLEDVQTITIDSYDDNGDPTYRGVKIVGARFNVVEGTFVLFERILITSINYTILATTDVTETGSDVFDISWTTLIDTPLLTLSTTGGIGPFTWSIELDADSKFTMEDNVLILDNVMNIFNDIQHLVTVKVTDVKGLSETSILTFNVVAGTFVNNNSIDMPGSDENLISSEPTVNGTTEFSVSYWINTPDKFDRAIFTRWNSVDECCWRIYGDGKKPRFEISGDGTNANIQSRRVLNDLDKNEWYHIVFTFNAGTITVYVNAVDVSGNTTGSVQSEIYNSPTQVLEIGTSDDNPKNSYDGFLDEFSTYNEELSQAEVTELYNGGEPTDLSQFSNAAALIEWYRLGDNVVSGSMQEVKNQTNTLIFSNGLVEDDVSTNVPP